MKDSSVGGVTELTEQLRSSLCALLRDPLDLRVPADHIQKLIELGLATRWAGRIAITLAGRLAAFPKEDREA
jgi:hypothetical protein